MKRDLSCFISTKGCAVIGASSNPQKAGYQVLQNMLSAGYPGKLVPVNPGGGEILGLKTSSSVSEIEPEIDMVIYTAPAGATPAVVADLASRMKTRKDIKALVCTAAGFKDAHTPEGLEYERMLTEFCTSHNIRMLGPNCVGLIDNLSKIDTTFIADITHIPGGISFVSQSGAIAAWLLMSWTGSPGQGVGFNKIITVGNMADTDIIEAMEFAGKDDNTSALGMYIEGSPKARTLVEKAGEIARDKPVLILKVGRSEEGAAAASSHTGSMAGSDLLYNAAFKQYGILRVNTIEELSDTLRLFDSFSLPSANRLFILTQAGGPGILCVDEVAGSGVFQSALINQENKDALREVLPRFASVCEPEGHADITAAANSEQHVKALEILLRDEQVDAVVFITTATLFLDLSDMAERMVRLRGDLRKDGIDKPILPVIISGNWVIPSRSILEKGGIPTYESPNRAVKALANMIKYSTFIQEEKGNENS